MPTCIYKHIDMLRKDSLRSITEMGSPKYLIVSNKVQERLRWKDQSVVSLFGKWTSALPVLVSGYWRSSVSSETLWSDRLWQWNSWFLTSEWGMNRADSVHLWLLVGHPAFVLEPLTFGNKHKIPWPIEVPVVKQCSQGGPIQEWPQWVLTRRLAQSKTALLPLSFCQKGFSLLFWGSS